MNQNNNKDHIISELQKKIKKLERKLLRSEINRLRLEGQNDKNLILLNRAKDEIEQSKNVTNKEMQLAGDVHQKFLQQTIPVSTDWDIAYVFKPMWGVSGDFYDFYEIDDKLRGLGIFDVSGHGIASGLTGIIAKSIIYRSFRDGLNSKTLSGVIEHANNILISEIGDIEIYLTGILLRFSGNTVEYVNAAHKNLLHKNISLQQVELVSRDINGYFLGVDIFENPYEQASFIVNPGDFLMLYTDCLSESHMDNDPDLEEFGDDRIISLFHNAPPGSAQDVLDYIIEHFYDYIKRDHLKDDLTIIVLKKK